MFFFFQAEDGIRYLVRSRGLGDVYKRQIEDYVGRGDVLLVRRVRDHEISLMARHSLRGGERLSLIHI